MFADFTQAQILWVMVTLQLGIFGSIWRVVAGLRHDMAAATRDFAWFNLALAGNLLLVGLRGAVPDWLAAAPANILGLCSLAYLGRGAVALGDQQVFRREPWVVLGGVAPLLLALSINPAWSPYRVTVFFVALAWLVLRIWQFTRIPLGQLHGKGSSWLLTAMAWSLVLVLLAKVAGGVLLGWDIEVHHTQHGSPVLPYFVLLLTTLANGLLAFVVVHRVLVQLETLNRQDPLTHVLNRRAFDEELARCWELRQRNAQAFAVLCLDIDHFKSVNDRFGHQVGDEVLIQVARALSGQLRPTDVLARTGGEEFVLLLSHPEDGGPVALAQRLCETVRAQVFTPDGAAVKVSVGLAQCVRGDAQADGVVARADAALYRAKAQGRNRVELSDEVAHQLASGTAADTFPHAAS